MYEMYPDAWPTTADQRTTAEADKPRRRVRREHSVLPPVIQQKINQR